MRETRKNGIVKRTAASLAAVLLLVQPAFAGGPLGVGGTGAGVPGVPLLWDDSKPIVYRVDAGALSQRPNGGGGVRHRKRENTREKRVCENWGRLSCPTL